MMRWSQEAQRVLETRHPQSPGLSRGNMVDSDLDTVSGDCLSCSDTNEVSVWTACKKCRKRVRGSCKLSKGSDWMEAQMKTIGDNCQDVWGHDHKIVRTKWKHALVDDCTSFEMRRMATRTNQLLHLAEATGSKIYSRESEVEAQDQQRPWSSPWNSSTPVTTDVMRRGQPRLWWVSKAYTWAMLSGIQKYWQVWAWSHSVLGVLNSGEHWDYHNPFKGGALWISHSMQCLLIVHQYVSAGGLRAPIKVQDEVTQEV